MVSFRQSTLLEWSTLLTLSGKLDYHGQAARVTDRKPTRQKSSCDHKTTRAAFCITSSIEALQNSSLLLISFSNSNGGGTHFRTKKGPILTIHLLEACLWACFTVSLGWHCNKLLSTYGRTPLPSAVLTSHLLTPSGQSGNGSREPECSRSDGSFNSCVAEWVIYSKKCFELQKESSSFFFRPR